MTGGPELINNLKHNGVDTADKSMRIARSRDCDHHRGAHGQNSIVLSQEAMGRVSLRI